MQIRSRFVSAPTGNILYFWTPFCQDFWNGKKMTRWVYLSYGILVRAANCPLKSAATCRASMEFIAWVDIKWALIWTTLTGQNGHSSFWGWCTVDKCLSKEALTGKKWPHWGHSNRFSACTSRICRARRLGGPTNFFSQTEQLNLVAAFCTFKCTFCRWYLAMYRLAKVWSQLVHLILRFWHSISSSLALPFGTTGWLCNGSIYLRWSG